MLLHLWLPIVLSAAALFVASFLSWVVSPLHRRDWVKLPDEDSFLDAVRRLGFQPGSYMFPGADTAAERQSPEHQQKWATGPRGVMTLMPPVNMGQQLALTFTLFLALSLCIAYLASLGLAASAAPRTVFRFVSTAGIIAFLPGILQHSIWFRCRVMGHVIESILYAAILGGIFAALWPR